MSVGFLIPLSLVMGLTGLGAFFWALHHDQFDDPEGDARRILIPQPPKQGEHHVRMASKPDHQQPDRRL